MPTQRIQRLTNCSPDKPFARKTLLSTAHPGQLPLRQPQKRTGVVKLSRQSQRSEQGCASAPVSVVRCAAGRGPEQPLTGPHHHHRRPLNQRAPPHFRLAALSLPSRARREGGGPALGVTSLPSPGQGRGRRDQDGGEQEPLAGGWCRHSQC